ncbi:MAG: leucyl aminopeptidase [Candidatus Manganitrophaceae bacterium]|nr:MAG: leucyl aminopeptidase [Candidatus Manganitrophaceae bacterium]
MEFKVQRGPLTKQASEVLILGHYEGEGLLPEAASIDKAIGGKIQEVLASEEFTGKFLQTLLLRTDRKIASPRLLLLGLGKRSEVTLDRIRQAAGRAATQIREMKFGQFATQIHGKGLPRIAIQDLAQAMVEGVVLGLYQFQVYKTDRQTLPKEVRECTLVEPDEKKIVEIQMGVLRGRTIAEAVNYVRDLCNTPSNVVTPSRLAEEAKKIASDYHLHLNVLERSDMERLGMGALLGVARGTVEPPKFIVLEYEGAKKRGRPVALIGKSVTFDSGGISLKPAENMEQMKYDMSGGATVLGTMRVAAQLKLPLNIVGILPATDNMPSGTAMHPGDVVTTLSGKTVEVINTDAEGRLCLADALAYAQRYEPMAMIDLATLTGACVVALGHHAMALFGNDPKLNAHVQKASEETGERVWPLPLWEEYYDQIKSEIADLKNTGGRPGGSITAALFLKQFVGETPWVHLDIAGTSWNGERPRPYVPKGSTGTGLRLLVQYLTNLAKQQKSKSR